MTTGHRSFRRIRKLLVPLLIFLLKVDHSQGRTIGRRPEGFEALSEHLLDKSQRIQVSYKSATTSHINFPRDLDNAEYQSDRIAKEYDPAKFAPIKIKFETTSFEDTLSKSNKNTKIRGQAILDKVLPHVLALWQSTLAVYPTRGFKLPSVACGAPEFTIPETMSNVIYDTDLIVFVGAFDALFDIKFCNSKDPALSTLAVSSPCHLDERNRPVIGYVNICLNVMEIHNGQVPPKVVESMTDVVVHELGHILGVNRIMFKYFVDAETGRPHTPQPFQTALAKCVNGQVDQIMEMPCNNTLVYHEEHISNGRGAIELRGYYEVVLPNVRQVVRNQFNCSSLSGARMENQPTSEDCIGSHFDERFFYSEFMSAIYDEGSAVFSPLTLAFLEDSGFYRVNFRNSKNSPFGLGAGCDFVLKDCIVNGTIPEYGKGYFCNERHDTNKGGPWACGPSHNYRGYCDLSTKAWPARTYFEKYSVGPAIFTHADHCPLVLVGDVRCDDISANALESERLGEKSKCVEVIKDNGGRTARCLKSNCNHTSHTFEFQVEGDVYKCEKDFQQISIGEATYECPRLTAVCPDMFCPAMCSGKGVCDWSLPNPICKCFDESDKTDGCYDSHPRGAEFICSLGAFRFNRFGLFTPLAVTVLWILTESS